MTPVPPPPPAIIEYTQPNCPHVAELSLAVAALRARGVDIVERDVTNPANNAEAKSLGVPGTPTIVVGGRLYAGDEAIRFLQFLLSIMSRG